MDIPRRNKRVFTSEKITRKIIHSPLQDLQNKNRQLIVKKRASKNINPLQTHSWISSTSSAPSLIIEKHKKKQKIPFNLTLEHDNYEVIETRMLDFLKNLEKVPNEEKRLKSEFKFYVETLKKICKSLAPYDKVIEKVIEGLSKYLTVMNFKTSDDFKAVNEKLMQKLKLLSAENIEFYKKNEDLKKELILVRKTVVYNETHYAIESLLKELSVKSDYISKCNNEINEYKIRELQLLKRLENRNMLVSPDSANELSTRAEKICKRSQSIKNIPLISFKNNEKIVKD
ncbi:hypothetical protein SteCoe_1617 [Stentor coeruleus]|uniref:Uncharacterized protein n=1 Tax=Stentor coeruleus TaxID=5963 RepID=A0A1R2D1F2_9CILI|nr:hypothetical protein SteCoe_1617 [Stentor coeruleus]